MDNNKKYIENIRFLSDFHFCNKESEDKLIKYITENFHSDIIILAGDFYDDFENTINFVKQLEFYEITGFLYWVIMIIGTKDITLIRKSLKK